MTITGNHEESIDINKDLRVLIIEDSDIDAELIIQEIKRFGYNVTWQAVDTAESLGEAMLKTWDIVLSDYSLPQFSGLEAMKIVKSRALDLPFILISGTIGEESAVEAMRAGVDDYLIKDNLSRLVPAIEREIAEARERRKLRDAEEKLRFAEFSIEHSGLATIWFDRDSRIAMVNEATCQSLGYTREELLQMTVCDIDPNFKSIEKWQKAWNNIKSKPDYYVFESLHRRKDGSIFPVEIMSSFCEFAEREYIFSFIHDITERKKAEEALKASEEQFRALTENSYDTIMRFDLELRHVYVSPMAERQSGIPRNDFIGKTHRELGFPDDLVALWEDTLHRVIEKGEVQRIEFKLPEGTWIDWLCIPEFNATGDVHAVITSARDITGHKKADEERERLQAQLLHAQKMEAVGRLAGGVAHDFNNMLSIILGYGELAKNELSPKDPLYTKLEQIMKAAKKSADLTRQLLAFSRQQIIEPKVLNLNKIIDESEKMIRRLIGEDIDLMFLPYANLWPVKMDLSQIDQILVNLAVNARDAMPDGGKLIIETANTRLDMEYCKRNIGVTPGDYVLLSVSDTGSGMDKEAMAHLFEPFFTTKKGGKGTGLGLSTVFGIVNQHNGIINVYSEMNTGTTFKIYVPRHSGNDVYNEEAESLSALHGNQTVLVVEDEEQILAICKDFLEANGYKTITAGHPGEAIVICEKYPGDIDLLITDVVMPTMNGKELKERIEKLKPRIRVLYMSGYTTDVIAHRGILAEGAIFIQKPFTMNDFLKKVKGALESE